MERLEGMTWTQRAIRLIEACEGAHGELERIRMLKEYELSVKVESDEGDPFIVDSDIPPRGA
jgi:hypothetical protein